MQKIFCILSNSTLFLVEKLHSIRIFGFWIFTVRVFLKIKMWYTVPYKVAWIFNSY